MPILRGVDPGAHKCAVATSTDSRILDCIWVTSGSEWVVPCDELHVEVPFIYPGVRNEDPNDLIEVAIALGHCIKSIPHTKLVRYYPRDWKGTIKKKVMTNRIKKILTVSGEIQVLEARSLESNHNALDACGILLHAMGRLSY